MNFTASGLRRRFLVPEVVQTSSMDCGPAAVKCLVEGLGVPISYGRLREACQTDVDGTSIDTMEELLVQLGFEAEQIMLPADHLLIPEARALPAIVVFCHPNGLTHFVVAWRHHGRFVQVMDPATGRRWPTDRRFLRELYVHEVPIPADAWREWASSSEATGVLRRRLGCVGLSERAAESRIDAALSDSGWRPIGTLDAATRFVHSIVQSGALKPGRSAARILDALRDRAQSDTSDDSIPDSLWSVRPGADGRGGEAQLILRGAVLVRVLGRNSPGPTRSGHEPVEKPDAARPLSPELAAALNEPPSQPGRELLRFLRADGLMAPSALLVALLVATVGVLVEAVLLRGLFNFSSEMPFTWQRLAWIGAVLVFSTALLVLEVPIVLGVRGLGRRLEVRLRVAFLRKIPQLSDRYFHSRPVSDMAERGHSVHELRGVPDLGARLLRTTFELVLTTVGIAWLDSAAAPLAILVAGFAVGIPLLVQPALANRDLRFRTHLGALGHFYLDAMMGLVAVRTHGAERAVRYEHEGILREWASAGLSLQRIVVSVEGIQSFFAFGLVAWLLFAQLDRAGEVGTLLLLTYWTLNLPVLGQRIGLLCWQYPSQRNVTLRLLEPLGAPEPSETQSSSPTSSRSSPAEPRRPSGGVKIRFDAVTVRASGHTILEDINLVLEPGSHVAVVGPSGAGKSSLVGLLLGWHRAASGCVTGDGEPLDGPAIAQLRQHTAWVDPTVQLWNRSLIDNLRYGIGDDSPQVGDVLESADLRSVLERLPDGLQTTLGEGGALVSGGEGQRVRLGRAMMRPGAKLVILDEPFRGLDRSKRRELLGRVRKLWPRATLLCISHDVADVKSFDRVIVVDRGRLVEVGTPHDLEARPDSRYRQMLEADEELRTRLWSGAGWRFLRLEKGRLVERDERAGR